MPQEKSNIKERDRSDIKEPGRYNVIFHNDDFTPMEFVTLVLKHIFFKSDADAESLMLKVHHQGKAIVGVYSYDIAMTKASETTSCARRNRYPLRVTVSKV